MAPGTSTTATSPSVAVAPGPAAAATVIGYVARSPWVSLAMALTPRGTAELRGLAVLVAAREWPSCTPGTPVPGSVEYASMRAGAHVRPIAATTPQLQREAVWLQQAVSIFSRQATLDPGCGVSRTTGVE